MNPLQLSVLGGFSLRSAEGRALRLPTRKAEALLTYLALEGPVPVGRERLAGLLWADADPAAALASVRQCLSMIGKVCGADWMAPDRRDVVLMHGHFAVDVTGFEAAAAGGDLDAWRRGCSLYRGELLAGFSLAEEAFESWLGGQRRRLHEHALRLHERLGSELGRAGRSEEALPILLRLLELDPLHEEAHRSLMRLYAALGRRSAALRQYQVCVDVLRRELAAEPEPATRRLATELLDAPPRALPTFAPDRAAMAAPIAAALDPPVHEARLVGRQEEMSLLRQALAAAREGRGQVVLLAGEPGVGKTRLTEELATLAAAAGVGVLAGHCHESLRLLPLGPWTEALRGARIADDAATLAALAPWRRELAALLPELGRPAVGDLGDMSARSRHARLIDAAVHLVERLVAQRPWLLLLEDLHWADAPSLDLLAALARRGGRWPLMLLATLRDEELSAATRIGQLRRSLERPLATAMADLRCALRTLSRDETRQLVHALQGHEAPQPQGAALVERVWAVSEGNPWVVVEAVRAARAAGPEPEAWRDDALPLPERVRELILGQVRRLRPVPRRVLTLLAVSGRETEFALLQRAAGLDSARMAETLEELVRGRLLRVVGENFDFTHARVRQAVHDSLLAPVRRALHLDLAQALEALSEADIAARSARLAHHFGHTDRHAQTVMHIARHAQEVAHAGAHDQALELLAGALAHAAQLPPVQAAAQRRELLLLQARSLFFLGRFAEVLAVLQPLQAAIDASGHPRAAAAYYLRRGSTRTYLGDHAGAIADAERALHEAGAGDDPVASGKAHFLLSLERFWDQPERGVWHGEQALRLLEHRDEPWWTGQVCWILGLNLSYRGRFAEGLAMQDRASTLAEACGDRRLASYAAWTTGFIHTLAGALEPALAACRRSVELALDPLNRMTSLGILALALVEHGDADEAVQALAEAIPQAVQFRIPQMEGLFLAFRAEAELLRGQLDAAADSAARGARITAAASYRYGHGWARRVQARVACAAGDAVLALRRIAQAERVFGRMGAPYEAARSRLERANYLERMGRPARAEALRAPALTALAALGLATRPGRWTR